MALAIFLRRMVLPALGGDTIRPRWPRPIGAMRFSRRTDRLLEVVSRLRRRLGKEGVRAPKWGRLRDCSGSRPLMTSTRTRLWYFSPLLGGLIWPETSSPERMPSRLTWEAET